MLQYAAMASGETGLRRLRRSSIESRTLAERYSSNLCGARLEVKASGLSRGRQCLPFKACGAGYSKYANNLCECPNSARFTRSRVFRRRSSPPNPSRTLNLGGWERSSCPEANITLQASDRLLQNRSIGCVRLSGRSSGKKSRASSTSTTGWAPGIVSRSQ